MFSSRRANILKQLEIKLRCFSVESATVPKTSERIQRFREELERDGQTSRILVDAFSRSHTYLRISLTEKCNLRCLYCMPAEGVPLTAKEAILKKEEIIRLADLFVKNGVRKIRLTGGEPTVRKDVVDIVGGLREIEGLEQIGMTTNGLSLVRQLPALRRAGLDALNISLDSLREERFEKMTRRRGWKRVMAGIDLAVQLGYDPVKINVVVVRNSNDDELVDFVRFTKDRPIDVRFIEYMPFSGNDWDQQKMIPFSRMREIIAQEFGDFQALEARPNDTSKPYKVPGFVGQFGFITSMSEHFCDSCNRLRITADGNLKVCLFEGSKGEVSLRDAMRSGASNDSLEETIARAVQRKKRRHAGTFKSLFKGNAEPQQNGKQTDDPYRRLIRSQLGNRTFLPYVSASRGFGKRLLVGWTERRGYGTLSHVDEDGKAKMVDVGEKQVTKRIAKARGTVDVGPEASRSIAADNTKKGDVLAVAQIAGIMAAKKTSELVPLCHPLNLTCVRVVLKLDPIRHTIEIESEIRCDGKTGLEMEALTAVTVAALTVYDMCKAVAPPSIMKIHSVQLVSKSGGKTGSYNRE